MKLPFKRSTASVRNKKPVLHLRGSTARAHGRSRRRAEIEEEEEVLDEDEEFYDSGEPTMKLSHAFIVVLILHLVAVAGIFGFNHFKARQNALSKIEKEASERAVSGEAAGSRPGGAARAVRGEADGARAVASRQVVGGSAVAAGEGAAGEIGRGGGDGEAAAKVYTVQAGDTLTKIARQHGVTVEGLREANGLSDQALLRIGQRLTIPAGGAVASGVAAGARAAVAEEGTRGGAGGREGTLVAEARNAGAGVPGGGASSQGIAGAREVRSVAQGSTQASGASAGAAQRGSAGAGAVSSGAAAGSASGPRAAAGAVSGGSGAPGARGGGDVVIYEVKAGDNPYSIARRHKVSYQELMELNEIQDPTKLRIGQKLKIPKRQ